MNGYLSTWCRFILPAFAVGILSLPPLPCIGRSEDISLANIPILVRQLGSDEFEERETATRKLEQIRPGSFPALHKATRLTRDEEVRWRASRLLEPVTILDWIDLLGSKERSDLEETMEALLDLGDAATTPLESAGKQHRNMKVRKQIGLFFERKETITRLVNQLGNDDFTLRENAADKLLEIGRPCIHFLIDAIVNGKDAEIQHHAKNLLQMIKDE
jgi:hypothetical protein